MTPLSELLRRAGVIPQATRGEAMIAALASDSRKAAPGSLFVCMPSANTDTHAFLEGARAKGAVAALVHSTDGLERADAQGLAAALVPAGPAFSEALWRIARCFHDSPTQSLRVLGVTGTNGKTTTAWIVRDALKAMGKKPAYLGTLGLTTPARTLVLENTTPFSVELHDLILAAKADGADCLVMEISSHALEERRADGLELDAAAFTNLTQDHLDFHGSMAAYEAAKRRLFFDLPGQSEKRFVPAFNVDDPVGEKWAHEFQGESIAYGMAGGDLRGSIQDVRVDGLSLGLTWRGEGAVLEARLGGHFNAWNCLTAAASLLALGFPLAEAVEGLREATPVPGRFEAVPNGCGIGVLVDYAHTPDALEKLLESARRLEPKRLISVFGCGGDRDRTKRPLMARVATERSDLTIFTSDNPRTEDPEAILADVAAGSAPGASTVPIVDRREAIAYAVAQAGEGDIIVIAGKGHEDYQIIGRTKVPMDDRVMAREALEARA